MKKAVKELWRLRWEYLKRSDNYSQYCEVVNNSDFIPEDDCLWSFLRANYRIFGNPNKESFENWWKNNRRYSVKDEYLSHLRKDGKNIVDYASLIATDMNDFSKRFNAPPSLDEFIQSFSDHLKYVRWLYLRVNVLSVNDAEIFAQIREAIRKKKQTPSIKEHIRILSLYDDPQGLKISALEKCLKVYDLKREGKSIRKIIENIGTASEKKDSDDLHIQREYKRYYQKAKKIIKNIERLDFPGKY